MSLGEHLDELRRRVILALYGLVPIVIVSMVFGKSLLNILMAPVIVALHQAGQPDHLISTGLLEAFNTWVKVSFIAAVLVGSPWLLYQLWCFIAPGLYSREKRFVYFLIPLSVVMTAAGVLFFYYVIFPIILTFMIKFGMDLGPPAPTPIEVPAGTVFGHAPLLAGDPAHASPGDFWINTERAQLRFCLENGQIMGTPLRAGQGVTPEFRVSESVSTILMFSLGFAAGFQMPVVVLLLGWAGMIDVAFLRKYRKHALLVIAILSALLTPADPFSMFLMMLPLCILYELGALMLQWFPASRVAGKGPRRGDPVPDPVPDAAPTGREPADAGDP